MYDRRLGKRLMTFGHEGVLYRNSFVMYDRATNSKWVHTTGEAVKGPLKGQLLRFLPSTLTSWGAWRAAHPTTTVLLGRKARGFMGSFSAARSPERYGLSLGSGQATRLYPYQALAATPLINDTFRGQPVVVVYDAKQVVAVAFSAKLGGQRLQFERTGQPDAQGQPLMRDRQTKSVWRMLEGRCVSGKHKGKLLEQLPATPWLVARWRGFYPDGEVYGKGR